MSQSSHGTHPFTVRQQAALGYLAVGLPSDELATSLRLPEAEVQRWLRDSAFQAELERLGRDPDGLMRCALLYGEQLAVFTSLDAMRSAADPKTGRPDYRTRLAAAMDFMNRAGHRGAPTQKQETKALTLTGSLDDALNRALRDPAVREWLESEPEMLKQIGGPLPPTVDEAEPKIAIEEHTVPAEILARELPKPKHKPRSKRGAYVKAVEASGAAASPAPFPDDDDADYEVVP